MSPNDWRVVPHGPLEKVADTGLVRVMVAHHETIVDRPAEALRGVATTL